MEAANWLLTFNVRVALRQVVSGTRFERERNTTMAGKDIAALCRDAGMGGAK